MDPTLTAAAIGVGGTVIVGVTGFWASVRNTNKSSALTLRAVELTEQGQVTDRYTKAVGQLGDNSSPVRVGGVYALERIGHDSSRDRTTIIYVLGAFIRERSRASTRDEQPPEDVMAGIRVAGRLLPGSGVELDLRGADLRNTDLSGLSEDQVLLDGANLEGAKRPRGVAEHQSDSGMTGCSSEGGVLHRHAVGPIVRSALTGLPTTRGPLDNRAPTRRYLKSSSSVYDVARHAFELRRGRVISSGVHDAPEAMSPA